MICILVANMCLIPRTGQPAVVAVGAVGLLAGSVGQLSPATPAGRHTDWFLAALAGGVGRAIVQTDSSISSRILRCLVVTGHSEPQFKRDGPYTIIPYIKTEVIGVTAGPEYGTTEAAWKAVLQEADRRCELHRRVKDSLENEVINSIKNWQKDNFHRQLMQIKEKKEMEEQFRKAQKPWAKLLEKVDKAKTNYHLACKNEKTAVNQERNATKDSSLSQDQVCNLSL